MKNKFKVCIKLSLLLTLLCITLSVQAETLDKAKVTSVQYTTDKRVKLTWKKVSGAKGYQVKYKVGSGKWKSKNTSKTYLRLKKFNSSTVKYKVRAYEVVKGKKVYAKYSKPCTVKRYSLRPKQIKISSIQDTHYSLRVKWKKVSKATKYQVYRSTKKSSGYKKVATTSKTYFNDTKIGTGKLTSKTYYYKVRAYRKSAGVVYYGKYSKVTSKKYKGGVLEKSALAIVNEYRAKEGLSPLVWEKDLDRGTKVRAYELTLCPDHYRPDGTDWGTAYYYPISGKCKNLNDYYTYNYITTGENISLGGVCSKKDTREAIKFWLRSPGHRSTIMSKLAVSMSYAYYNGNAVITVADDFSEYDGSD